MLRAHSLSVASLEEQGQYLQSKKELQGSGARPAIIEGILLKPGLQFCQKTCGALTKNSFSTVRAAIKTIVAPMVAAQMITAAAGQPNKAPPASVSNKATGSDKATDRI